MDEHYKLRVKIGVSEFEADGPPDLVKQQYADFLAAVANAPATMPVFTAPNPTAPPPTVTAQVAVTESLDTTSAVSNDVNQMRRVYRESDAVISLLALPQTDHPDADAVLLLIYGYHALRPSDYPVSGVRLMQAAKQSGLHQVERIHRAIGEHDRLVLKAGLKRGRKYSLNNQGVAKARELINGMLG